MEEIIQDIQEKIRQNRFPNEASISQGIVLRLIRALGWNVDDIDVVWPEFSIGSQRADFALCDPPGTPLIIIEVKQPGTMNILAEEQLAVYAFQQGVPLVVLTSGQDWHFFAPYGPGQFSDRRFYRLDLLERSVAEASARLARYLSFSAWSSKGAIFAIQTDLNEMLGQQETRRKLPEAWAALLSEPDSQLVELLTVQFEKQTGSEPHNGEVIEFLKSVSVRTQLSTEFAAPSMRKERRSTRVSTPAEVPGYVSAKKNANGGSSIRLWIDGVEVGVSNHRDRLVKTVIHLLSIDPNLPQKFSIRRRPGQRPTFARTSLELFPGNPQLASQRNTWTTLPGPETWYLDLNKNAANMRSIIEEACKLVGVRFGKDVRISG